MNIQQTSALLYACFKNDLPQIQKIMNSAKYTLILDVHPIQHEIPLLEALKYCDYDSIQYIFKWLLDNGYDIEQIKEIVNRTSWLIDKKTFYFKPAIYYALHNTIHATNSYLIIQLLIKYGANVNIFISNYTCLAYAIKNCNINIVKLLIDNGAYDIKLHHILAHTLRVIEDNNIDNNYNNIIACTYNIIRKENLEYVKKLLSNKRKRKFES